MRATVIKLIALFGVSGLATAVLLSLLSESNGPGPHQGYHAIVSDASLLAAGDAVRIAGVTVGEVQDLAYQADETVKVDFSVGEHVSLPHDVHAAIRYKNLIGDRVLVLTNPGNAAASSRLPIGATIPLARTEPALDLDALTGGFKPLLQALDPEAVNELSANLLAIVQGEGGSVKQAFKAIAEVSDVVADQGAAVERIITNLDTVMTSVDTHSNDLGVLIDRLERLVRTVNDEREPVLTAVRDIGEFSDVLATFLEDARPPIADVVRSATEVARTMNRDSELVTDFLEGWGPAYQVAAGIGVYGDFFDFYVCDVRVKATGPSGKPVLTPWVESSDARCDYQEKAQ